MRKNRAIAAGVIACAVSPLWAEVMTFQNDGVGYWGAQDVELFQASPANGFANSTTLSIDAEGVAGNAGTQVQSLLKFNNLFGSLPSQIPFGSTITGVSLTFNTTNVSANSTGLYRMTTPWNEQSTWASHGPVSVGAADATVTPGATGSTVVTGPGLITSVQAWANGTRNEGWAMVAGGTDGWDASSSESGTVASRPKLSITYTPPAQPAQVQRPKNVILFVGDGMGLEHIKAAKLKTFGNTTSSFAFEFADAGFMTHNNSSDGLTDSAASATAMATGVKTSNGRVSRDAANTTDLPTALEQFKARGKRTGLVTTAAITDATPAAFGAHVANRTTNASEIATDYVNSSRPNVLFGAKGTMPSSPTDYHVVTTAAGLQSLDTSRSHVSGQFGTVPALSLMATRALDVVGQDPDGFFLLVENEDIDSGGHDRDIDQVIDGVVSLSNAVEDTIAWLTATGKLQDTLILVVADHETGDLKVVNGNGIGQNPTVTWEPDTGGDAGHTQTPVGVWALGPNAGMVDDRTIDNTDVYDIMMTAVPEPAGVMWLLAGVGILRRRRRCAGRS